MSLDLWKQYCQMNEECAVLGGGEPTLHPQFWEFLTYALGHCDNVFMVTNGSQTEMALTLAGMTHRLKPHFECEVSQDAWHAPISSEVVHAFGGNTREIRNPVKAGRCTWGRLECVGEEPEVWPDGRVRYCGCTRAPWIGTLDNFLDPVESCWSYMTLGQKREFMRELRLRCPTE